MRNLLIKEHPARQLSLPRVNLQWRKKQISKWDTILTLEDHLEDGGFGSWIKEAATTSLKTKIISKSINAKVISKVGTEDYLLEKYFIKFLGN